MNDAQKESIKLLNNVFESILSKGRELFPESKPLTELPQPSTMINSFKIRRKSQPEHVTMVSIHEDPVNLHKFQMISSTTNNHPTINNTEVENNIRSTQMLLTM